MAFELICDDGIPCTTFFGVITGTHSAGKSTLIKSFSDNKFEIDNGLADEDPFKLIPRFGGMATGLKNEIPLITTEEAAGFIARSNDNPKMFAEDYSFDWQIKTECTAIELVVEATVIATRLSQRMHSIILDNNRSAVILTDRSALDGKVYSSLRTPVEDQEIIDTEAVNLNTIGFSSGTVRGKSIPLRACERDFISRYCDFVVVADHTEVPFEDNGMRQTDLDFRDQIAVDLDNYYRQILGDNRVYTARGNIRERHLQVLGIINRYAGVKTVV